ncbi:MAG: 2-C-methyl-D-erythritol 2,4-cyclodiphosphate synthase [Candidatus Gastranaerophilales bacterium]|nr:2-C-methyl-D-erythritol 2,4-cyclodiphosphate synthase [Candidatus Gastranaerophilales bacterium]
MRIGIGYDIHKLVEKRDLILGGVKIPYELGLLGHSDADVLIHAIIDSMLGAVALRDIGFHFPDTDERFKDANSMDLLKETKKLIQKEGYKIGNIDSNIICQKPKLMSYIEEMRANIASVLELELNQISIKAKTNEKMDSIGNGTAIVANAVCLLNKI